MSSLPNRVFTLPGLSIPKPVQTPFARHPPSSVRKGSFVRTIIMRVGLVYVPKPLKLSFHSAEQTARLYTVMR